MQFLFTGVCNNNNNNTDNIRLAVFFSKVFNHELMSQLKTVENPMPV